MKTPSLLPLALIFGLPAQAEGLVEITYADGTTEMVRFDELPSLAAPVPDSGDGAMPQPVVSVVPDGLGVSAQVTLAPVIGIDQTVVSVAEDDTDPVIGSAQDTTVTVVINEPDPTPPKREVSEISLPGMNFETNKYAITPDGMKRVAYVAQLMQRHPGLRVQVTGHTDDVGSHSANDLLSRNRAKSFRSALIQHYRIDPERITWRGLGERAPVASNATAEGRYANRRIVITPL